MFCMLHVLYQECHQHNYAWSYMCGRNCVVTWLMKYLSSSRPNLCLVLIFNDSHVSTDQ